MRYMITENQVHTGTKQINLQVHVMIRNIRPEYHISRYILHVYTERDITYQVLTGRQYERLLFLPSFGTTSALFRFSSCFFLFTSFIRFFFHFPNSLGCFLINYHLLHSQLGRLFWTSVISFTSDLGGGGRAKAVTYI